MSDWIPLFQTLVWPVFILVIAFLLGRERLQAFVDGMISRIQRGQGPVRFPGGFEFPQIEEGSSPDDLLKEEPRLSTMELTEKRATEPLPGKLDQKSIDVIRDQAFKDRILDWGFLVGTKWMLLDTLVVTFLGERYFLASRRQEVQKKTTAERLGLLAAPEYKIPLAFLEDLRAVERVVDEYKRLAQYTDGFLKKLKDAYFRLERLIQYLQTRIVSRQP